eukprot:13251749-Alexandrium_andersonii.AAC.1
MLHCVGESPQLTQHVSTAHWRIHFAVQSCSVYSCCTRQRTSRALALLRWLKAMPRKRAFAHTYTFMVAERGTLRGSGTV